MSIVLMCLAEGRARAQALPGDSFTFFGVAEPQGPVTASYLRMHQPLVLLEMCRKVQAGAMDRERVEGLVGRSALDALLAMDLDALLQKLTGPHDAAFGASMNSLWHQILTNGETAPVPSLDLPGTLTLQGLGSGAFPSRILRVTSPTDGALEASFPAGSPFQILSMRTYDGIVLRQPTRPHSPVAPRTEAPGQVLRWPPGRHPFGPHVAASLGPEFSRTVPPWTVPVQAGQDVDIEVGLPVGSALPPAGLSATLTLGERVAHQWQQSVAVAAQPPLPGGSIFIAILTPETSFEVIEPPRGPTEFRVPLTITAPSPAVRVTGMVKPLSLPDGVSMPTLNFTLLPQGTLSFSLPVSIETFSQAWRDTYVSQPFSIQVSYQTVSSPYASRTDTLNFTFVAYPYAESWKAKGSAGGVNCVQSLVLWSDGKLDRDGRCDNNNFYTAKIDARGNLVGQQVVGDFYQLGIFDFDYRYSSITWSYGQANYVFVGTQPLIMSWTKY
jgi:hypothetical protein